jgi:hypothetical protein
MNSGATMTEQNNTTHMNDESSRSKRRKAIVQGSKTKASPGSTHGSGGASQAQTVKAATTSEPLVNHERDRHIFIKIQERAYSLFVASGFKHGHELEHWLEAEKQVVGSSDVKANQ